MVRLFLHHCVLATPTIAKRCWQKDGQLKHHLIDSRTGHPAQTDALSVSVIADRTVMAEIYAKVDLILGVEEGRAYLQSLADVEGLVYIMDSEIVYTEGLVPLLARVEPEGYQALTRKLIKMTTNLSKLKRKPAKFTPIARLVTAGFSIIGFIGG